MYICIAFVCPPSAIGDIMEDGSNARETVKQKKFSYALAHPLLHLYCSYARNDCLL